MANLQNFINQWNGKTIDFDGVYGAQCVDSAKKWNQELGYGPRYGNGKDWINNAGADYTRVNYSPGLVPPEGAIVSWSGNPPANVPYGHVAIATGKGDRNRFETFDQNWGGAYCKLNWHSYQAVQGWIVPKNYQTGGGNMIENADNWFGRMNKLMLQIRGREISREEFTKNFVGVEPFHMVEILSDNPEADNALQSQQIGQQAQREDWAGQIATLRGQNTDQQGQIEALTVSNTNLQTQIDVLNGEVASLKKQLADQVIVVPEPSQPLVDYSLGDLLGAVWTKITRSIK